MISATQLFARFALNFGVQADQICKYLGYAVFAGTPNGNVTPDHIGQELYDTTNKVFYKASDTTNTSWKSTGNGVNAPASVALTIAQGASSNICLVTMQLNNAAGAPVAGVFEVDTVLSDASTGIGLTATTASGAVAAGASGTDIGVLTTKKATRSLTDATGKYILSITDTAKTGFFVGCGVAGLPLAVSRALVAGDYK